MNNKTSFFNKCKKGLIVKLEAGLSLVNLHSRKFGMGGNKRIKSALISVYHKEGLEALVKSLDSKGIDIYSTGGTYTFIENLGLSAHKVEDLTGYPSILGGRVKTLHPKVFGGILSRRDQKSDREELKSFDIPEFDMVVVDLYPFEQTLREGGSESEIIEKIDIGGISLIRAAAKNFNDVLIVSEMSLYERAIDLLASKNGSTDLSDRKYFAARAFAVSSHYDTAIFNYFNQDESIDALRISESKMQALRYGENPHQHAAFFGDLEAIFDKIHGKDLSYNNLLDLDAAINLMADFKAEEACVAILKHNNACGLAIRSSVREAWEAALAGDPVSAFGGVIISNQPIDKSAATAMNTIFFELLVAPDYETEALEILQSKKNRILLRQKNFDLPESGVRRALNGYLFQQSDRLVEQKADLKTVTTKTSSPQEIEDMLFANKIVKHTKSNTIVLAKNKQLLGSGTGQTSRVDALKQAIAKAKAFNFDLRGAVMASDAFFPFPDCVEIAHESGITSVIQPGGSIKDGESIDYCNENGMSMSLTGNRHFKH